MYEYLRKCIRVYHSHEEGKEMYTYDTVYNYETLGTRFVPQQFGSFHRVRSWNDYCYYYYLRYRKIFVCCVLLYQYFRNIYDTILNYRTDTDHYDEDPLYHA